MYVFPIEDKDGNGSRHGEEAPVDWVPTYRQGVALREQTTGRFNPAGQAWREPRNTVVREGCTCRIRGQAVNGGAGPHGRPAKKPITTRFLINPTCAIHGGLVDREIAEKTPAGVAKSVPAGTEIVKIKDDENQ